MENTHSSVVSVSMSDYSSPQLVEKANKDFVTNGEKNEYFRFLSDITISSATNRAVIEEICRNVYGKGLTIQEEVEKPVEEEKGFGGFMKGFFSNGKKETVTEMEYLEDDSRLDQINDIISPRDIKAIVKDRIVYGQASFKILYTGTGHQKKVHKIKHFPIQTLAPKKISVDKVRREATKKGKDDYEFKGEVEAYYYHPKWEDYKSGDELTIIPAYGYGKSVEIYVCKDYMPGCWYFNPVDWSGAIDYAILEKEVGEYLVNDIHNGFSPTILMNVNRSFDSHDKRQQFVYDTKSSISGSKGNKILVQFNSSQEEATTIEHIEAPPVDKWEKAAIEASRKIITAHRIGNPKLLGIPTPGEQGLGNNANEIEVAFNKFLSTVVGPYQDEILDALKELFKINGIEEDITFIPNPPLDFDKYAEKDAMNTMKYSMDQNNEEGYNDKTKE